MKKHALGLVIGRFQPFHLGHQYLITNALKHCETLAIGIGSSNVSDENNIFSYAQRKKMLEIFLTKEEIKNRVSKIFPVPDVPSDKEWFTIVLKKVTPDVVIGNNDWVNGIFEKARFRVKRVRHYKRYLLEGTKIRQLMSEGRAWHDRVPSYLVSFISK